MRAPLRHAKQAIKTKIVAGQKWFEENEKRISSFALVFGFIFDSLTLTRIDQVYDNLVIVFYLILAFVTITFIHLYESWTYHQYVRPGSRLDERLGWVHLALPTVLQFVFGGLFSAFFIFYSRSATLAGSWPFLIVLLGLLIGNEFFRRQYVRLTFQVSLFTFAVYSYAIFAVPILVNTIGWWVFLLSGVITLGIISGFLYFLSRLIPTRFTKSKHHLIGSTAGIFIIINTLYFTGVIPPIPLSLQDAGVYYSVNRTDDGRYIAHKEQIEWYDWYTRLSFYPTINITDSDILYVFSSVFAPTDLYTRIVHKWRFYDPQDEAWKVMGNPSFPIIGGRDEGFRGYSFKSNITPGYWKVTIETADGRVIGSVPFYASIAEDAIEVEEVVL